MSDYDVSRIANFGRDTAKAYGAFLKAQTRLADEINTAIVSGAKPIKVAYDLMGRCPGREAQLNLLTVLSALTQMGSIPDTVFEPFEKGIVPKRV